MVRILPGRNGLLRLLAPLSAFLFAANARAVVLDPPVLRCASVDASGDVTLTWTPPADPGGDFLRYEIFHATAAAGPFTLLATVAPRLMTTYTHVAAGAVNGPRFYHMTTVSSSPPPNTSVPGDTVATLHLLVAQSAPLGSAVLTWTAPARAPTAERVFTVWMEHPAGNWTQLAQVGDTVFTYRHVVTICADSLTFRVGLADLSGCVSFSNLDGDVFQDATPPCAPVPASVSVDSLSGRSTVAWEPCPELDTDGYIIVLVTPTGGVIIDTVFGRLNTTYTWPLSTPGFGSESFTVASFDTCRTGVPPSPNTSATRPPHGTMHARTAYDRCAGRVTVEWTPYIGWPVQSYQVLAQVDGGGWSVLANVPGDRRTLSHTVPQGRTYCYIVRAVQGPGQPSSLSNKTCRVTSYPGTPAFNYLRTVTVSGPSRITVLDSVDTSVRVREYRLERSDAGGPFTPVASAPGGIAPLVVFVDDDVSPGTTGYRYRVVVVDSCGAEAITSNTGGNILLRATPRLGGTNLLEWNGYATWAGNTVSHVVHRSVEDAPFQVRATVSPNIWTWADNVQGLASTSGRACYYVRALEGGNPSGVNAVSESNIACAVQEDLVFIPNAFVVGGANPVFRPVLSYVDVSAYELSIINRWGQVVWTTNDPGQGWDGRVGGGLVPIGVYGYYCTFQNGEGRRFEKRGTVTMLTALD